MTVKLMSPNRRHMVDERTTDIATMNQLRTLGWLEYQGSADATTGHTRATSGWVIPGTDPDVDKARAAVTGNVGLGNEGVSA